MVRVDRTWFHFTTPRNIFLEVLALLGNITELAMEQVAVTEAGLCSGQPLLPQHCVGWCALTVSQSKDLLVLLFKQQVRDIIVSFNTGWIRK